MKQDLKNLITNPTMVLFSFVYPISLVLLFGFLFSNLYGGKQVSSYDFYGITMIFYLVLTASTVTPTTFMEERIKRPNLRINYCPVSRVEIYLSKLLSTFIFTGSGFLLNILILHFTRITNFGKANFPFVLLLFFVLLIFSITLGGTICVLIRNQDLTNKIIGSVVNTLALLSGIFFPVAILGKWVDNLAELSPIKWVLNTIFEVIYDNNFQNYIIALIAPIILSALLLFVIHKKYRPEKYI